MASSTVHLPTEVTELVIDELDVDGSSVDAKNSHAALRSCLFVSRQFHQRARSHLFRNIVLHDVYRRILLFRNRLILLGHLLTTSINDHDPGIVSNIRELTISVTFGDDEEDSDDETEHVGGGEEENSIARVIAKHFPPILRLIKQYAHRLENLVIEDTSNWFGCEWDLLPLDLILVLRGLLSTPTLRRLEFRNFVCVPDNLFDSVHVTHLVVEGLYPKDEEVEFDGSNPVPPFDKEFICGPLEFLQTDQCFPLQRIVDISAHQSADTTKTKLLKKIRLEIHDKIHFTKVVCILRAASLAEDLHLDFMKHALDNLNPSPKMNLDLFPLQKLTRLTMSYDEDLDSSSLESGPKSREIAYSILKSRSCSIMYLTLEFNFEIPNIASTPDYLIYPTREHWGPFDNILAGPHYPKLCLLVLRITLDLHGWGSSPSVQTAIENCRNRFAAALPLLSASNRLCLYLLII
ncbi:hypothetical protein GALMADRAFT_254843 [Galerina marginata CBS 339.88]|uniref:F-box domain-containing protein n=1 Tax=Galerina marginata (strain CBS 339.88) TaxID=685588 RepID=A0A067SK60_GALM3|nr:hypothetical protein GALMADRAFT_254843 [Galerina marginata CBS 339.88]